MKRVIRELLPDVSQCAMTIYSIKVDRIVAVSLNRSSFHFQAKCPIYSVIIEDLGHQFMNPPDSGILYFLQGLHCLDLMSKVHIILNTTGFSRTHDLGV